MTTYNFCAGPAMLPVEVMAQAQQEFVNWQGQGCSVMELSHRSKPFIKVAADAEQDLRDLLAIPANYKVLFMHGGGRGQFSAAWFHGCSLRRDGPPGRCRASCAFVVKNP
mgnify:CR=1 FL=1